MTKKEREEYKKDPLVGGILKDLERIGKKQKNSIKNLEKVIEICESMLTQPAK